MLCYTTILISDLLTLKYTTTLVIKDININKVNIEDVANSYLI